MGCLALFKTIRLSLQLELGSPATSAQQQSAPGEHLSHEHASPLQAVSGPLGLADNVCLSLQLALGCTGIGAAQQLASLIAVGLLLLALQLQQGLIKALAQILIMALVRGQLACQALGVLVPARQQLRSDQPLPCAPGSGPAELRCALTPCLERPCPVSVAHVAGPVHVITLMMVLEHGQLVQLALSVTSS